MHISVVKEAADYIRYKLTVKDWNKKGNPIPTPDIIKQRTVREYAKIFSVKTFIETGTYLGDMVDAVRGTFNTIYSIELDTSLYEQAQTKFSRYHNISIFRGDSSTVLPVILADIDEPCLFWLDSHYSGGITARGTLNTPVVQELSCILGHPVGGHIILIDDARLFTGHDDYPSMEGIRKLVSARYPDWTVDIKDDIIRIHK